MSDAPNTGTSGSDLMFMLGGINAKLDGLSAGIAAMKDDHRNLVSNIASENTAMKLSISTGDNKIVAQIDSLETRLDTRIDGVERATSAVVTSFNTTKNIAGIAAVVIAGVWAAAIYVFPIFHAATAVLSH